MEIKICNGFCLVTSTKFMIYQFTQLNSQAWFSFLYLDLKPIKFDPDMSWKIAKFMVCIEFEDLLQSMDIFENRKEGRKAKATGSCSELLLFVRHEKTTLRVLSVVLRWYIRSTKAECAQDGRHWATVMKKDCSEWMWLCFVGVAKTPDDHIYYPSSCQRVT